MKYVSSVMVLAAWAGVAAAKPTIDEKAHTWDQEFDIGDAFAPSVQRARELFGDPQQVETSGAKVALHWALETDRCTTIDLVGIDGYVDSWHTTSASSSDGDEYAECHAKVGKPVAVPPIAAPKPFDVDEPAREVMAAFAAGKWQAIFDGSDPELQGDVGSPQGFAHLWSYFPEVAGEYVKLGPPTGHAPKNFGWQVTAPAIFEKGTLDATICFTPGKHGLVLRSFKLTLPPALRHRPTAAEATPFAKHAVELLLADDFDKFDALFSLGLDVKVHGHEKELGGKLHELLGALGKATYKLTKQESCPDVETQCFTFAVVGKKGKTTATITAHHAPSRWEVDAFNIDQP